jgi:predicted AAA+ superfamily ATPase
MGKDMPIIKRNYFINEISKALNIHAVLALLGPRQCGKTTLAKLSKD